MATEKIEWSSCSLHARIAVLLDQERQLQQQEEPLSKKDWSEWAD